MMLVLDHCSQSWGTNDSLARAGRHIAESGQMKDWLIYSVGTILAARL